MAESYALAALRREGLNLKYELPKLIQSLVDAWKASSQSAAVVSTLFAATSAQLLGVIKSDDDFQHISSGGRNFVMIASYAALVFNSSATIYSLILTDWLGDIPMYASRPVNEAFEGESMELEGNLDILRRGGGGRSLTLIFWFWILSLIVGIMCIFSQIVVYVWLREENAVKYTVIVAVGLAFMPLVILIPYRRTIRV